MPNFKENKRRIWVLFIQPLIYEFKIINMLLWNFGKESVSFDSRFSFNIFLWLNHEQLYLLKKNCVMNNIVTMVLKFKKYLKSSYTNSENSLNIGSIMLAIGHISL